MKTAPLIAVIALGGMAATAQAEVSSTITVASDYDFRGISQTARDPALQASLDWSGESGLYVGAWASNVDFGDSDVELDLLAGYRGSIGEDASFDVGVVQYLYLDTYKDLKFTEAYAGFGYKAVSAKVWYAWDFSNSGKSASYIEANAAIPMANDFTFNLHAGYSDGDFWGDDNYTDYSIGISKTVGNFALNLKWVDGSDLAAFKNAPDDIGSSESKVVFTVATTLPWGN